MNRWFVSPTALACAAFFAAACSANAAEIKVLATGAHVESLKTIVPDFEKASGHKVTLEINASPVTMKNIESGTEFDAVVAIQGPVNETAKKGFIVEGDRPVVSIVGLGAAIKEGTPKPDISTAEGFKQALLKAKGVSILPESVNGKHFIAVFDKMGIGEQIKGKIIAAKAPGDVAGAVARGDADIALFIANGLKAPGVTYAGAVPAEFDQKLVFVAGVSAKAKEPKAAGEFVKYMTSAPAFAAMKASGLDTP